MVKKDKSGGQSELSRGKSFVSGALVLSLSTLIVKIIGLGVKIPMLSLLGAQGMGYFNSAYEIYALLCTLATAGLPIALSMLVSEAVERGCAVQVARTYRVSFWIFFIFGALGTLFMAVFSEDIAIYIGNADAAASILAISPSLLLVCVASAGRGYFQGFCQMTPTAVSQLIEALSKLILGIAFVRRAQELGCGVPVCAAAAILGISVGSLLSFLYLYVAKKLGERKNARSIKDVGRMSSSYSSITRSLVSIALPITLGASVIGITRIVDMTLIMRRLGDVGISVERANEIFGSYTTLAVPIFSLIPSLITPISLSLVPALSGAIERGALGEQSALSSFSLRLTVLFAMPASFGIAAYSREILELLFAHQSEAIDISAPLLSVLGISILFSCIITTSNAILQSYRKTSKPIISMAIGAAVKMISGYVLIGIPSVGAMGAPISTLLCNIVITAINIYYMKKYLPSCEGVRRIFLRPLVCCAFMMLLSIGGFMLLLHAEVASEFAFFGAMGIAAVSYFGFCLLFGAITREDIALIPAGERLLGKFIKTHR